MPLPHREKLPGPPAAAEEAGAQRARRDGAEASEAELAADLDEDAVGREVVVGGLVEVGGAVADVVDDEAEDGAAGAEGGGDVDGRVVDDGGGAEAGAEVGVARGAGSRDDAAEDPRGDLDGVGAHAAAAAVHEDLVAPPGAHVGADRLVRRHGGRAEGAGVGGGHRGRQGDAAVRARLDVLAQRPEGGREDGAEDGVAGLVPRCSPPGRRRRRGRGVDAAADLLHDAGVVETRGRGGGGGEGSRDQMREQAARLGDLVVRRVRRHVRHAHQEPVGREGRGRARRVGAEGQRRGEVVPCAGVLPGAHRLGCGFGCGFGGGGMRRLLPFLFLFLFLLIAAVAVCHLRLGGLECGEDWCCWLRLMADG